MSPTPDHWIRPNEASQVPTRFIFLDTEARTESTANGEKQYWRCAVANFVHWTSRGNIKQEYREYDTPEQLWSDIDGHTRDGARTVLYAHNLPYDMRIARLLVGLPATGYRLECIRLDNRGSWSRWRKAKATLLLCDTASIFPTSVATLALLMCTKKVTLPEDDNREAWLSRCRRDVEIISSAMVEYLTWLRTGAAGNWQMTGSSQSWSHWRHCHYTDKILIHHDEDAIAAERRALWTGRAENWRWGKDNNDAVYEYDFQNAYPRVASDVAVPTRLVGSSSRVGPSALRKLWQRYAVLAQVEVDVRDPCVPAKVGDGIGWPVGSFTTTLWDPELRLLEQHGQISRVDRVWLYEKAPALKDWADWVMHGIHSEDVREYRWLPVVLKHWSRALIGRFAMRYQSWDFFGQAPDERVQIGTLVDRETGVVTDTMQIGRDFYTLGPFEEANNSCPQITGYIMSESRAKLWRVIQKIGAEHVYYMDTDSLVVDFSGDAAIRREAASRDFAGLVLKGTHRGWEIYGPRSAIFGGAEKFAGMPRFSHRISGDEWLGEVWSGLEHSIKQGEFDHVTITKRRFTVRWNDKRRIRLPDGTTAPHRLPAMAGAHGVDGCAADTPAGADVAPSGPVSASARTA